MRGWSLLLGTMALLCGAPAAARADPFADARMATDGELDAIRGGFLLPNGMDIGLGIMIETMIDGRPALNTVLTIDDSAHLAIYTGGHREPHASTTELLVPGPNGSSLIRIPQNAPPASGGSHGQPIAIVPNGAAADTPWGAVHLVQSDTQSTVVLAGNGLELRQMIGTVTGALVANTASDRVIDTMVTFDLDIRHSAIPTSAMMLRLDSLLAGAAARGGY